MPTNMEEQLTNFHHEVALKYHLYNSLFLTLPFGGTEETGTILPLFAKYCATEIIQNSVRPDEILSHFFKEHFNLFDEHDRTKIIFKILQFVERQILLFDALEDAAFSSTHDVTGSGSLANLIARVKNNHQEENFIKQLSDYHIKIVLTAHPTQFYPDPVLGIITQLTPALQDNNLKKISQLLIQLGKTSFKHAQKPTPFQEAQSLVWYLENVFYKVVPDIQQAINYFLSKQAVKMPTPAIELGFWPGSDRDGNPYVNHQVTLSVSKLLKHHILNRYIHDLRELTLKLTFPGILNKLSHILKKVENTYLDTQTTTPSHSPIYQSAQALLDDLESLRTLLIKDHQGLFLDQLDAFIIKVKCFEFYFASMDIRENASVVSQAFEFVINSMPKNGKAIPSLPLTQYRALPYAEKIDFLKKLIDKKISYSPIIPARMPGPRPQGYEVTLIDYLQVLVHVKEIQTNNGKKSVYRHIISNTSSAFNVLELLTLFYLLGNFGGAIPVDIIPLFESIEDLDHASHIMEQLYQCDFYSQHLKKRQKTQTIMLGFSDGTKDGGYVTANWAIYKAKLALTAISEKYGIKVVFFDGRGGPPARGGGNTHDFYRSLGSKIRHKRLELTIQGQTISSNFGNYESAKYNLEQLFTAGLEDLVFPTQANDLSPDEINLLGQLSDVSATAYQTLKNHPLFIPYLEQMTPLQYYGELNIGSRPTARKQSAHVQLSSLRAIPFVGSWSQLKQNVPGFYGFGAALQALIEQGKETELKALYQHSLFFRTLVENAMMSLSKSFFKLTAYMRHDKTFGKFWQLLASEAENTQALLLKISQQKILLENDPINRESIKLREDIVLPLLVISQFALIKLHELNTETTHNNQKLKEVYKKILLKTLAASTNASRNSA